MLIIVAGTIGQSGVGGQVWATLQYLLGLRELGHEVVYLEDGGDWSSVYHWELGEQTTDIRYPAGYVHESLAPFGFGNSWIYRVGDQSQGMPAPAFVELCSRADLLIMRAAPISMWRPEYSLPRRRVFIDVDPGFTQMRMVAGNASLEAGIRRCERHFTVGTRIGKPNCTIPDAGFHWIPTLPPVSLAAWPFTEHGERTHFTSIMRWRGFHDVEYDGVAYGQKDKEFPQYVSLPELTHQRFRLALMGASTSELEARGWESVPSREATRTPAHYHDFITNSRAEFSVPKHTYVATRSGWFSDRSVCYLASGRPVLIGDTGIGDCVPTGEGLVTFRDLTEAVQGVEAINADYERHCQRARRLAEQYFGAATVLTTFLDEAVS